MGIERKETLEIRYTCDRCSHAEVAAARWGEIPKVTDGWAEAKLTTWGEFNSPVTASRYLCPSCTSEFRAWFKDAS